MKTRNKIITTILLALGVFPLSPIAQAVNPAPDGGYPGGNTAEGQTALLNLSTGGFNTAVGYVSLRSDTSGSYNTAIGAGALVANTGDQNTATGAGALLSNTTGANNTANGVVALFFNTAGTNNTAIGGGALFNNTTGNNNTANGVSALVSNMMGNFNTADGFGALLNNITGDGNTAIGRSALSNNTSGGGNTALGANAGNALTTGVNNIDIGLDVIGVAGESNTIRIGNTNIIGTFIRGISGSTAAGGATVYVESDGHLGTMTSSARFKDEIKPIGNASEAILALRPVSFRYKKEIDRQGIPEFGLIAEEVEKVNPELVIRDSRGRPQTVRYEQINAMLLNEFLKEHRRVEELEKAVAALNAHLKEQDSKIQKVSAQIEINRTDPGVVTNDPRRTE